MAVDGYYAGWIFLGNRRVLMGGVTLSFSGWDREKGVHVGSNLGLS